MKNIRAAVILFHKNIDSMYPKEWITRCIESIRAQTDKDFTVYECSYGGEKRQLWEGSEFFVTRMKTHTHAHNFLLDKVFEDGFQCAFNVNLDDYYAPERFERQLLYIEKGFDVISSNFIHVDEHDNELRRMQVHKKGMVREARRRNNIIAHPAVCYSRNFWLNCSRLNPDEIPRDDFELWMRSYGKFRFHICQDYLLYYRIHENSVS